MSRKVAILGMGPSAAFAVLACRHTGITPTVYSSVSPSVSVPPVGAFFYHKVPGAEAQSIYPTTITVIGVGGKERYFSKQWGYNGESTFPAEPYADYGYEPSSVWRYLWGGQEITSHAPFTDESIAALAKDFDFVFQTFPTDTARTSMSQYKTIFPATTVRVRSTVMLSDDLFISPNTIIYDGTELHPFVRASSLFGILTKEYPKDYQISTREQVVMIPDLLPSCPEWPENATPAKNVFLMGRWAEWKRHMLAHEAYDRVWRILHD